YEEAPCLVVEVVSESTEAIDRREKLWRYREMPSTETVKLRVSQRTFYYPDLMVVCGGVPPHTHYEEAPCLVVEVVSESTEAIDRREKLWRYREMPS
ncbi:Uma2 family endonuclease, partial [Streptococcus pneumoniae]|uniref:Uma2 family endonuclease n=1 Tax=Streptococcus pneumoniae TaxID=1313 RepID=UPI00122F7096